MTYKSIFLGFDVINVPTRGMGKRDFIQTMKNFAADEGHGDIMVLAVMSHGGEDHRGIKIITSNYEELDIEFDVIRYKCFDG